jgi:mannose-6-phosphate isomerase
MKLATRYVEKPWGRTELPPIFGTTAGKRIGEVRFIGAPDLPIVAKYLFTAEKLSIQVHPDDQQARIRGYPRGKSECWYILDAQSHSKIGLGLKQELSRQELRDAALDGSIDLLIDWRPVKAGDFVNVAPGTIHAVGGGISLVEFHCNSDATFRLYDYGRPRPLHVADAVAVAKPGPFGNHLFQHVGAEEERILFSGPEGMLAVARSDLLRDRRRLVVPLDGCARIGGEAAHAGECLLLQAGEALDHVSGRLLLAAAD